MMFGRWVGQELFSFYFWILSLVAINSIFHLMSESSNEALYGPSCCITKSTNSVTFNLIGKFFKHVYLSEICVSFLDSFKQIDHPSSAFSAWGALTTALVLVEFG